MNIEFVLSMLGEGGPRESTLLSRERQTPLHAMAISTGWQVKTDAAYDWHGLRRGKAEFVLMQYTLRGWGLLDYEGVRHKATPGTAMLLHFPHDNRYRLPPESEMWEFVYVCLNGRELVRLWRELVGRAGPLVGLNPDAGSVKALCEIFRGSCEGLFANPFDNSAAAYGLAMALLKDLAPRASEAAAAEKPEAVRQAIEFCRGKVSSPIGVGDMAAAAGLSRHHFSRVFSKAQGIPPASFLKDLRLKEAAKLLQTSRLSIKEVGDACGFGDSSYFCRVFRESFGMTPESYRSSGIFQTDR